MDLDKLILKTFDNRSEFFFPIMCQEDAKEFVRALSKDGVNSTCLCDELEESEVTFTSWKNGLARSRVGKKVIQRINKPLEQYLWSACEVEDLRRNIHKEVERIRDTKNARLKVHRKIVLGRTNKSASKKQPVNVNARQDRVEEGGVKQVGKEVKQSMFKRNYQRSWSKEDGEEKKEEDFKTIRLKKVGRSDLYEGKDRETEETNAESKSEPLRDVLRGDNQLNEEDGDATKNVCVPIKELIANFNNSLNEVTSTTDSEAESTKSDHSEKAIDTHCNSEKDERLKIDLETDGKIVNCIETQQVGNEEGTSEECNEANSSEENTQDGTQLENRQSDVPKPEADEGPAAGTETTGNYLYIFTDSNSCNSSPIRNHRFKVGLTDCPLEELQRASEFNLDIKLISATAVSRPLEVLEVLQSDLEAFQMKGRDNWFYCPLSKMLQSSTEAISRTVC